MNHFFHLAFKRVHHFTKFILLFEVLIPLLIQKLIINLKKLLDLALMPGKPIKNMCSLCQINMFELDQVFLDLG